jgi:hypothetical protein
MRILEVESNGEIFREGEIVIHRDGNYTTKIVKFTQGPREDQMWFYFSDNTQLNDFEESGEDNYVKDLKNFKKLEL